MTEDPDKRDQSPSSSPESSPESPPESSPEPGSGPRWNEPDSGAAHEGARAGPGWQDPPRHEDRASNGRSEIERNVTSKRTWLRLVFIVLFAIVHRVLGFVLTIVVVIQFLWALFTGAPNERLRELGQSLARYSYQIIRYLTYNTDERPFPVDRDWPSGRTEEP